MSSLWNIPALKPEMECPPSVCFSKFVDPLNHWYQTAGQSMTTAWDKYHEVHRLAHEHGVFEKHREPVTELLTLIENSLCYCGDLVVGIPECSCCYLF